MIWRESKRLRLELYLVDYGIALHFTNLETLKARRLQLSKRFALKCTQNEVLCFMFLSEHKVNTRYPEKYFV